MSNSLPVTNDTLGHAYQLHRQQMSYKELNSSRACLINHTVPTVIMPSAHTHAHAHTLTNTFLKAIFINPHAPGFKS